ncbi:MAG: PAS domain-containing protein [Desulfobulbaceae bacterium]|nr:PAS domain-containing protein [Desulfobulbaceae bacterium]
MERRDEEKGKPLKAASSVNIKDSIATRLLRVVFGFYLVIAIGVTVGHMFMEYSYQKENIKHDLKDIQQTFERGLAIDLWQLSEEAILSTIDGMLEIPVIVGVKIQNVNGLDVAISGIIRQGGVIGNVGRHVNLFGLNQDESAIHDVAEYNFEVFMHQFPVEYSYGAETTQLGKVTFYSNTSVIIRRVKLGFILLVINAVLKTVALWVIFLLFSNYLLRRPLAALSTDAEKVSMENLDSFKVKVETSGRNELKVLEESLNSMIGNLNRSKLEQEQTQIALHESEKQLRRLVTNIPGVSYSCDPDEQWTMNFISDEIKKISGYPAEDFIGNLTRSFASIMHPDDLQMVVDIVTESVEQKKPYALEYRILHASGEVCWVFEKGQGVFGDDGQQVSFEGVIIDITKRKRAEHETAKLDSRLQQAQKMEAIGTLAGGIAHDFNNILGAILGYTEMAKDDSKPGSTIAGDLEKVLIAGERAKGLVQQILAFSRQSDAECIAFQPASVVKEAINMLRPTLPTTIEINQDMDPATGLISADPTQINQILMNLCTNAFHAMEKTGGKLDITLKETHLSSEDLADEPNVEAGTFIQISICDSGPGIAPDIKEKIFDPYFTTKETGKGTGMGLSIVHGIVKSYGGFISFYSELGEGTAFHVFLPVIQKKPTSEFEDVEKVPVGRERILFIDDEEILAEMGKHMLERLGYHVTVRTNSLMALETFQNMPDQFDVVITDQTMPGMTGEDIARRMIQIRPDIPIVLCTGYSTIISEEKAKFMGIKEFALKPLSKKDLAMLIRKVLDNN